jgi:hypothetical protein
MIITEKEILEKLETEFYKLHDWFGRYDQLIWKMRGLLFTIYAAVIVYSFSTDIPKVKIFATLACFAVYFLIMEIYWLHRYWTKRTKRYRLIQAVINSKDEKKFNEIELLDMEDDFAKGQKVSLVKKIGEPILFYIGLVIVSVCVIFLF